MKKILLLIVIAVLVAAAATNPSESKAKEMITNEMSGRLKQTVNNYVESDESSGSTGQLVSALAGLFAPSIVELCTNVKVNNYLFFTTYEVTYVIDRRQADESGYILFGSLHRH